MCPFPWDQCVTDSTTCLLSPTQGAVNGEQRDGGRRRSLIQDSAFSSPDAATTLRRSDVTLWPSALSVLTQPFSGAHVGTLLHKSRRIRRTITHDFSPFALA